MYSVTEDIKRAKDQLEKSCAAYRNDIRAVICCVFKVPEYGDTFYTIPEFRPMVREHGQAMHSHEMGGKRWVLGN